MAPDQSFMARFGARLVDSGFPVIPIMPGTKKPGRFSRNAWRDYPGWSDHCRRPTSEHEISVWSAWPDSGIGIAGGRVAGIDIDITSDPALALDVERLARERLGDTPAMRIGRPPKRLLVYRASAPFKGFKRPPIEVLCEGQQFVAFAIHPDTGKPYEWPGESLADLDLADLPEIAEHQARPFLDEAYALIPEALRPATLKGGERPARESGHHDLRGTPEAIAAALAFIPNDDLDYDSWVRIGMAIKGALGEDGAALFAEWSARSRKNVPENTAKSWASFRPTGIGAGTIHHHAMAGGWKPDAKLSLNGKAATNGPHPAQALIERVKQRRAMAQTPAPTKPPPAFFDIDGALKLFVDYMLATAIRPQPVLAIGAALAALGVLMGRKYRTASNLRTNLYVICMAESGAGKDHARNCIKEAFIAADLHDHLGGNKIASGAGLLSALHREPASLFQLDEFGQFLGSIVDKRRAPKYLAEIWDLFTELATSAGGTFLGAEYADQKERPRQDIVQPCCCVHATTVPGTFWAALQSGSLVDGSLARFLLLQSDDDIPDRVEEPAPIDAVPAELIAALQAVACGAAYQPQGNIAAAISAAFVKPDPYIVPMSEEAKALFNALDADTTAQQRDAVRTNRSAILARVWENTAKVALIKAVSANPREPIIRGEDAEWARLVVGRCVAAMLGEAERHLADNETERAHKRVLRLIRETGAAGLTKNEITRQTQYLERRQREEILISLIESRLLVTEPRVTAGRPAIVYRGA